MTKAEFEAIKTRAATLLPTPQMVGDPDMVIICFDPKTERSINPDTLGTEVAARFKARCEAMVHANTDRAALLKMLTDDFEIEWPEDAPK